MIGIVLTLDYEIFGDGTGSVREYVIDPTNKFLNICEKFNVRSTIFVEVAEILKMKEYERFSSDVFNIEQQLKKAHRTGHDIQLHIHPWWYTAKFQDGRWDLDYSISSLAHLGFENALQYVGKCKDYLAQLLQTTGISYSCTAFRAGAFSMIPTEVIHYALTTTGIEVDSSVFKWGKMDSNNLKYDYTNAYSNIYPWHFSRNDVNIPYDKGENQGHCLEIPIYTEYRSLITFITWKRIKLYNNIQSCFSKPTSVKVMSKIKYFFDKALHLNERRPKKFDFCKCTFYEMRQMVENIMKYNESHNYLPVVAIGHSKDFIFQKDLVRLLSLIHSDYSDVVEIVPLTLAVDKYFQKDVS